MGNMLDLELYYTSTSIPLTLHAAYRAVEPGDPWTTLIGSVTRFSGAPCLAQDLRWRPD